MRIKHGRVSLELHEVAQRPGSALLLLHALFGSSQDWGETPAAWPGAVYALDATSGTLLWMVPTAGQVTSSPAVANGVVYVGAEDDNVYAIDASSGTVLWTYTTGNAVESSPTVANGMVYVGSLDDNVYAFGL